MLILTPFIWKDTIYLLCKIFAKVRNSILPLCLLTSFVFYTLSTSLKLSCTSGYGNHPEARNILIWRFGHISLVKDSPSGYWFSPRSEYHSVWGLRLPKSYARFTFGPLVFTPKIIIYEASVIRVWCKIPLRVISFHPEATFYMGFGNLC